jgi:uncharacterized protein (DUF2249 family)
MNSRTITLDVREDFRLGKHPREKIQNALGNVAEGGTLRLLVPFEPVPLFAMAAGKGLVHKSQQTPQGDWEVLFTRNVTAAPEVRLDTPALGDNLPAGEIVDLDARGLEPPQPLIRILEALARLPQGATLRARTDRRPVHLYSHLEDRGVVGQSEEQKDGSYLTHIHHA